MSNVRIDPEFWRGKKVFLTGHTGFKGSWLTLWLQELGATVKGYSLEPPTTPSLFELAKIADNLDSDYGDIRDFSHLTDSMTRFNPDILIHMAAQPLVRYSYQFPIETYEVNVIGTAKVLEAALNCRELRAVVNVTTDKCYENREWIWGYREDEAMGGYDPYSSSKGCAELVTAAYRRSFFANREMGLASARAGNVIGGGDWATDRLLPDILRAFEKQIPVVIRSPKAVRPWQYVLEPLGGYLTLAQYLYHHPKEYSEGWNFGPNEDCTKPVDWIIDYMVSKWPGANWKLETSSDLHEAAYLKLDISKAKMRLKWTPTWDLPSALKRIIKWHHAFLNGDDVKAVSLGDIRDFMKDLNYANHR